MKAAVITFPGSNCDRDLAVALEAAGAEVVRVWQDGVGWYAQVKSGGETAIHGPYSHVAVCNGHHWDPNIPEIPGTFTGSRPSRLKPA